MVTKATASVVAATAAALALGALALAPGQAAAQGYFGPGRDGDYQPPAYGRDRTGPERGDRMGGRMMDDRRFGGGGPDGPYARPLHDREPYGYGGAGADRMRPDRFGPDRSAMDRLAREEFERGYRMGREEERSSRMRGQGHMPGHMSGMGGGMMDMERGMPGRGGPGHAGAGFADDENGVVILLIERSRQQQAMQDIRRSLTEARTALQQGDRARAESALNEAEQTVRAANLGGRDERLVERWLNQAEQALQRNDREEAQRSLQRARQAMRGEGGGGQQQQPTPQASGSQPQGTTGAGGAGAGAAGTGGAATGATPSR